MGIEEEMPIYWTREHVSAPHIIGEHTYGIPKIHFPRGGSKIIIGKFCSIAMYVNFLLSGEHPTNWTSTYPFQHMKMWQGEGVDKPPTRTKGDIVVGNDVWIGQGVNIMSGVTIGDGAVIGAYSVVASDVRPYAVAAGNPAREIRLRFSQQIIDELLKIKWWNWPDEKIKRYARYISGPPEMFLGKVRKFG